MFGTCDIEIIDLVMCYVWFQDATCHPESGCHGGGGVGGCGGKSSGVAHQSGVPSLSGSVICVANHGADQGFDARAVR
jgi:hypothetical protein